MEKAAAAMEVGEAVEGSVQVLGGRVGRNPLELDDFGALVLAESSVNKAAAQISGICVFEGDLQDDWPECTDVNNSDAGVSHSVGRCWVAVHFVAWD